MSETNGASQGLRPLATLRRQVIVAMAIVLSPLLFMGGLRVIAERGEAQEERFQELLDNSRDRVVEVESALGRARLALRMLALDDRRPSCSEIAERLAKLDLPPRNILRFDTEGRVTCHHVGDDLIGEPMPSEEWNELLRKGLDLVESSRYPGMALGDPAIYMLHAQLNEEGIFAGSVAVTIGLRSIAQNMSPGTAAAALKNNLVLQDGTVIGSDVIQSVPQDWLTSEAVIRRELRQLTLPQGRRLDIVLQQLSSEGVWMLSASSAPHRQRGAALVAFIVPILIYLAALLAASWIADAMVLRWLERLRLRISDLRRSGDFAPLAPDLTTAPAEFQQLAEAFDELTHRVTVNETELNGALARMRSAFRETHHRVKNNLQIMLSMLKLQGRGEVVPETQQALRVAAHRVAMMAAVHHSLLNEADLQSVDANDLFSAICDQIHEQQGWFDGARHVMPDVESGPLPADFAIPLAMFVLEAFNMLCKPRPDEEIPGDLRLVFTREGDTGRLQLSCVAEPDTDGKSKPIDPGFFLGAFARQIGGAVTQLEDQADRLVLELTFPLHEELEEQA